MVLETASKPSRGATVLFTVTAFALYLFILVGQSTAWFLEQIAVSSESVAFWEERGSSGF